MVGRTGAVDRAAEELIGHWASASTGSVHVATLAGPAEPAVAAFVPGELVLTPLYLDEALERLVWASASGGARGRRRGLAAGRSATWWLAHRLVGARFPTDPGTLGDRLDELGWYLFAADGAGDAGAGWTLRLAIEHPDGTRTTVIDAHDHRTADDPIADDPTADDPTADDPIAEPRGHHPTGSAP